MGEQAKTSTEELLRELDSYRTAIRDAFNEGFAMAKLHGPLEVAWERSEARQTDWAFAHTRIGLGHIARRQTAVVGPVINRRTLRPLANDQRRAGDDSSADAVPKWLYAATVAVLVIALTADYLTGGGWRDLAIAALVTAVCIADYRRWAQEEMP